ncbi:sensor histidine kinase [Spirochaeta africana]|nr:sensor histidine kinase [Spirochaeta africana]
MQMRHKLAVLFFLFSFIPLILLGSFASLRSRSALGRQAIAFSENLLSVTAVRIGSAVDGLLYASRTIAVDAEAKQLMMHAADRGRNLETIRREQSLHMRLNSVRVQNPQIRSILLVSVEGDVLINGVPTSFESMYFRQEFRRSSRYQELIDGRGVPVWVTGIEERYDRVYLMQRMVDSLSGRVLGVLVISFNENTFTQMFREARGQIGGEMLLVDPDGRVFAAVPEHLIGSSLAATEPEIDSSFRGRGFIELSVDAASMWQLIHRVPQEFLLEGQRALLIGMISMGVILALLSVILSLLLPGMFSEPVRLLLDAMHNSRGGRFLPVDSQRHDEFAQLYAGYNLMVSDLRRMFEQQQQNLVTIEEQKQTIEDYSTHLEGLVQERTRDLVESEKMASLGGLVVGVSHEINTPVGTSITAVSIVHEVLDELRLKFQNEELRRSDLSGFFLQADQSLELARNNLQRASDLISSFKRVAVNQSIEEPVRFYLQETLRDIARSLKPRFETAAQRLEIDCPFELELYSYPGVFYQIVVNLLTNAFEHAYPDAEHTGIIRLYAELQETELLLQCSDDGDGMSSDVLERVFDPFFTTARSRGGTGLGLHIVYNLITQKLNGRIAVDSAEGRGTTFLVKIPLKEIIDKSIHSDHT